jgi:hypothetical protein
VVARACRALAADLARSRRDFSVLTARQRMLVSELSAMQVAASRRMVEELRGDRRTLGSGYAAGRPSPWRR